MPQPYLVSIVVDPEFGDEVRALAACNHVWLAHTSPNRAAAEAFWRLHPNYSDTSGVTTFRVDLNEQPADWAVEVLPDVMEHHGEYSHDPPVKLLEFVGTAPTQSLREALAAYGFSVVQLTSTGFRAELA